MNKLMFLLSFLYVTNSYSSWNQVEIEGLKLNLYIPKNIEMSEANSNALMVNLHGCAQTADNLMNHGNWDNVADQYNMVVAIPFVPNGGKYAGCWDYYGSDHSINNRDNVYIIKMVKYLLAKKQLKLDANQVYVSGLSSGGGEALVLGCLAPDIFTGIGINAGPTISTSAFDIGVAPTQFDHYLEICKQLARLNNVENNFKTQLTSIVYGDNDYLVNPKHNIMNAELMSSIYGANLKTLFDVKSLEGEYTEGFGNLYSDKRGPRVSIIMNKGLGHNWPAGQGGSSSNYINKRSINYPKYITKFFFDNNRRSKNVIKPKTADF